MLISGQGCIFLHMLGIWIWKAAMLTTIPPMQGMDLIGGQVFLFVLFTLLAIPCSMWDLIP